MSRSTRRLLSMTCVCLALCLTGCVDETQSGDTTIFTFALWVPGSILLAGVAGMVGGWFLRPRSGRWGWGLMILGLGAATLGAPSLLNDKATVSPKEFTLRTGFFFAPTQHAVQFDELSRIDLIKEVKRGRRGRRETSYSLSCQLKSGEVRKVPVNNLMEKGPFEKILVMAVIKDIPVNDQTGD